ncbi:hypothetical protein AAFF_G00293970 [Aldrovandia affinis]|uniref:Uncharacterized protein n=1 Tax=Aldrovandia affinis TaxID=143900 RepID=A0AAD7R9U8_9TELE|nr:hypothetical protein AAFF_G00293970 [Aldrovandia affinis]
MFCVLLFLMWENLWLLVCVNYAHISEMILCSVFCLLRGRGGGRSLIISVSLVTVSRLQCSILLQSNRGRQSCCLDCVCDSTMMSLLIAVLLNVKISPLFCCFLSKKRNDTVQAWKCQK